MPFRTIIRLVSAAFLMAFSCWSNAQPSAVAVGFIVEVFYADQIWLAQTVVGMVPPGSSTQQTTKGGYRYVAQCSGGNFSSRPVLNGFAADIIPETIDAAGTVTARVKLHVNHINQIRPGTGEGCVGQVVDADTADVDRTFDIGSDRLTVLQSGPIRVELQRVNPIIGPANAGS